MLGSIISAGASLLGGLLGKSSQEKQAEQNIRLQKQFAQEGIQWKVEDAKKAGIHPLYALGAQTHSFAPVSVGDTISPALASAGQDIGRAIDATRSTSGKLDAYAKTVQALNLERMGLENQILGAQLAKTRQVGSAPPMPTAGDRYLMDGQSESGLINTSPMARQAVAPEATSQEAGAVADLGFTKTPTGYAPVMSKDAKDRLDDDLIGTLMWNMRNRLGPAFGASMSPPPFSPGEGKVWMYNPFKNEYQAIRPVNPY